jgi:hypothetical protein
MSRRTFTDEELDALERRLANSSHSSRVAADAIAFLRAERAAVRADATREMVEALETAEAWLERWATHVGSCKGGMACTCGLSRALYETTTITRRARAALEKARGKA